jgi:hypothetical protein
MGSDSEQMVSRYLRRRSRLYRLLHPPRLLVYNPTEKSLPHCEGVKLFIGGAAGDVPSGFLNVTSSISLASIWWPTFKHCHLAQVPSQQ